MTADTSPREWVTPAFPMTLHSLGVPLNEALQECLGAEWGVGVLYLAAPRRETLLEHSLERHLSAYYREEGSRAKVEKKNQARDAYTLATDLGTKTLYWARGLYPEELHRYQVLRSSGRTPAEALDQVAADVTTSIPQEVEEIIRRYNAAFQEQGGDLDAVNIGDNLAPRGSIRHVLRLGNVTNLQRHKDPDGYTLTSGIDQAYVRVHGWYDQELTPTQNEVYTQLRGDGATRAAARKAAEILGDERGAR